MEEPNSTRFQHLKLLGTMLKWSVAKSLVKPEVCKLPMVQFAQEYLIFIIVQMVIKRICWSCYLRDHCGAASNLPAG